MRPFYLFLLMVMTSQSTIAQDWESVTELRYKSADPTLFARVMEARELLDRWRGEPDLLSQAYELLDAVLKQDEDFAPAYLEAGRMVTNAGFQNSNSYVEGTLQTAAQYLLTAVALDADYSDAYVVLGHVYLQMKRLDDADEVLAKAEEIGTDSPWLNLNKAAVSLERRDYANTLTAYQAVVDAGVVTRMTYADALRGIANANQGLRDMNAARQAHQKLLDFEPDSAWNWGNYGSFQLYSLGDYNNAIITLEKTLRMMEYPLAQRDLACALIMRWSIESGRPGQAQSAQGDYLRALVLFPDSDGILDALSRGRRTRAAVEPFRLWLNQNNPGALQD